MNSTSPCKGDGNERCLSHVTFRRELVIVINRIDTRTRTSASAQQWPKIVHLSCPLGHVNTYCVNATGEIVDWS
jgi:hypothetical protein